ncbi:hypothetical protein ACJX0J_020912 [Zea mays]
MDPKHWIKIGGLINDLFSLASGILDLGLVLRWNPFFSFNFVIFAFCDQITNKRQNVDLPYKFCFIPGAIDLKLVFLNPYKPQMKPKMEDLQGEQHDCEDRERTSCEQEDPEPNKEKTNI